MCRSGRSTQYVLPRTTAIKPYVFCGAAAAWQASEDGIHLVNHQCPYRQAAEISKLPCESDRKTIELLLGLDVEQLRRIVDGAPVCEYIVRNQSQELRAKSVG